MFQLRNTTRAPPTKVQPLGTTFLVPSGWYLEKKMCRVVGRGEAGGGARVVGTWGKKCAEWLVEGWGCPSVGYLFFNVFLGFLTHHSVLSVKKRCLMHIRVKIFWNCGKSQIFRIFSHILKVEFCNTFWFVDHEKVRKRKKTGKKPRQNSKKEKQNSQNKKNQWFEKKSCAEGGVLKKIVYREISNQAKHSFCAKSLVFEKKNVPSMGYLIKKRENTGKSPHPPPQPDFRWWGGGARKKKWCGCGVNENRVGVGGQRKKNRWGGDTTKIGLGCGKTISFKKFPVATCNM